MWSRNRGVSDEEVKGYFRRVRPSRGENDALGELLSLGEEEICRQVDDDTSGTS